MNSSAPDPADVVAERALVDAARVLAGNELLGLSAAVFRADLRDAALAYAQAVKDAKRARKTTRRSKR